MDLTSDEIFEFLDLYEAEPVLWNLAHPLHRNRNEIRDSWNRIQRNFSVGSSIEILKKKRDSLMATFRPLLKKVKKSMKSGSVVVYKPNWFAFYKMAKFLMPVYQDVKSNNADEIEYVEFEGEQEEPAETRNEEADNPIQTDNHIPPNSFKPPLEKRGKRRRVHNADSAEPQMTDVHKIAATQLDKDICTVYGELLAMRLREFDEFNRDTIMNKIDNMIYHTKLSLGQSCPRPNINNQHPISNIRPNSPSSVSMISSASSQNLAEDESNPWQGTYIQEEKFSVSPKSTLVEVKQEED